ncbi:hypothetical protein Ct61P_06236 [Colletotrichum tofieldiae]|nr:hypothetical protein Ct61P_06236 [Colletotrichum tofieldiae]
MATARSIEGNAGGELAFVDVGRSRAVSPLHGSNRRGIAVRLLAAARGRTWPGRTSPLAEEREHRDVGAWVLVPVECRVPWAPRLRDR